MKTMLKFLFMFLVFVMYSISISAQKIYTGQVVNKNTKQPVSYASIAFLKINTGINANEAGYFTINVHGNENDTLAVSSIGYNTLKIPVNRLHDNISIELDEKPSILKEVTVQNAYKNSITLNKYSSCIFSNYATNYKIAQHFTAPTKNALLSEINICKSSRKATFRIQVYDMDTITKSPTTELTDTIIEVNSEKKHVKINVEQYKIIIPNRNFFIAIEWLRIPENAYTETYTINGEKKTMILYAPMISFREIKEVESIDALRQYYSGKWEGIVSSDGRKKRFLISVKLKY